MLINYLDTQKDAIFIDVRSPGEHEEGTIGNAINIPLFSNEERAEIGTAYKQMSVEKAKKMAVEAVSKKLPDIYDRIIEISNTDKEIVIFCARGGMRSNTLGSLINALGHPVRVIDGGYKAYRNAILEETKEYAKLVKFIVLHGNTGTAKTRILHELIRRDFNVLDIEGAANHRGSMLGRVGLGPQPTQKTFEHRIFEALRNRNSKYIFVEAESKRLGINQVCDEIMEAMKEGVHINVSADIEFRIEEIVTEYMKFPESKDEILFAISKLKKFIGNEVAEKLTEQVTNDEYGEVARVLMVDYYDPKYEFSANKYTFDYNLVVEGVMSATDELLEWSKKVMV